MKSVQMSIGTSGNGSEGISKRQLMLCGTDSWRRFWGLHPTSTNGGARLVWLESLHTPEPPTPVITGCEKTPTTARVLRLAGAL